MEEYNEEILKKKIYVRTAPLVTPSNVLGAEEAPRLGFVFSDGTIHLDPENDFYINLLLTRTHLIDNYVDVQSDKKIYKVERQEFNPYFIEFGFFDSIARVRTNSGSQLTPKMLQKIRDEYSSKVVVEIKDLESIRMPDNQISPSSIYYNKIAFFLTSPQTTEAAAGRDFIELKNTPYDGLYPIRYILSSTGIDEGGLIDTHLVDGLTMLQPMPIGGHWLAEYYPNSKINIVRINFITDQDIINWYDNGGRNMLSYNTNEDTSLTLDELEKIDTIWTNLVSKANYYPIQINK